MKLFCGSCDHDMSDSTKKISKPRQVFYVNPKTERDVSDIVHYHPFEGSYVICSECQTLNEKPRKDFSKFSKILKRHNITLFKKT